MATKTVAVVSADLVANTSSFESGMARARSSLNNFQNYTQRTSATVGKNFNSMGRSAHQAAENIRNTLGALRGVAGATAGFATGSAIIRYSDQWKALQGRLSTVEDSMDAVRFRQEELTKAALEARVPLGAITDLYVKIKQNASLAAQEQTDLIKLVTTFSKALALAGVGTQQINSAVLQFSQAASSDFKTAGQELSALADSAPLVFKILDDSAKKTLGQGIKKAAEEGKISTLDSFAAIINASTEVAAKHQKMGNTLTLAFNDMETALLKYIGTNKTILMVTDALANGMKWLAQNLNSVATGLKGILAIGAVAGAFALAARLGPPLITAFVGIAGALKTVAIAASLTPLLGLPVLLGTIAAVLNPMTVAFTAAAGAAVYFATRTTDLGKALEASNEQMLNVAQAIDDIAKQSLDATSAQWKLTEAFIESRKELIRFEQAKLIARSDSGVTGVIGDFFRGAAGKKTFDDRLALLKEYRQQLAATETSFKNAKQGVGYGEDPEAVALRKATAKTLESAKNVKNTTSGVGRQTDTTVQDTISNLREENAQMGLKLRLYGQSEAVVDGALRRQQLYNSLQEKNIALTSQQREEIESMLTSLTMQEAEYKRLEAAEQKREEAARRLKDNIEELGFTFSSAFEDAVISGSKLSDVIRGLTQDIARLLLRVSITQPLASAFAGKFAGAAGGNTFFSSLFGGAFAAGGNPPVGKAALVGENGPEMIVPRAASTVIPNHALAGGKGSVFNANITVNQSGSGDAQSARQTANAIKQELDVWFNAKMRESMRPGNTLNPVF